MCSYFSSTVQNSSFENIFSGKITILERERLWHEQFGLFSCQGYNWPFQYADQACGVSLHVLFLRQPEIFLPRKLLCFGLPCLLCHWYSLRICHLFRTWISPTGEQKFWFNFYINVNTIFYFEIRFLYQFEDLISHFIAVVCSSSGGFNPNLNTIRRKWTLE